MKKTIISVMCIASVCAVVTACKNQTPAPSAQSNPETTNQAQTVIETNSNLPDVGKTGSGLDIEAAKSIALADAGVSGDNAVFVKDGKDIEDGREVYDIEFVSDGTKYDYEIGVSDGSILKYDKEAVSQSSGGNSQNTPITEEDAKSIALDSFGLAGTDVTFTSIEKDRDNGKEEYDLEFYCNGMEYSCSVDIATGQVTDQEIEIA